MPTGNMMPDLQSQEDGSSRTVPLSALIFLAMLIGVFSALLVRVMAQQFATFALLGTDGSAFAHAWQPTAWPKQIPSALALICAPSGLAFILGTHTPRYGSILGAIIAFMNLLPIPAGQRFDFANLGQSPLLGAIFCAGTIIAFYAGHLGSRFCHNRIRKVQKRQFESALQEIGSTIN